MLCVLVLGGLRLMIDDDCLSIHRRSDHCGSTSALSLLLLLLLLLLPLLELLLLPLLLLLLLQLLLLLILHLLLQLIAGGLLSQRVRPHLPLVLHLPQRHVDLEEGAGVRARVENGIAASGAAARLAAATAALRRQRSHTLQPILPLHVGLVNRSQGAEVAEAP